MRRKSVVLHYELNTQQPDVCRESLQKEVPIVPLLLPNGPDRSSSILIWATPIVLCLLTLGVPVKEDHCGAPYSPSAGSTSLVICLRLLIDELTGQSYLIRAELFQFVSVPIGEH
jgi:hypothetical protein